MSETTEKPKFTGVIKQALITTKNNYLKLTYVDHIHTANGVVNKECCETSDVPVSDKLIKQFNVLRGHVAAVVGGLKKSKITDQYISSRQCMNDPEMLDYRVIGLILVENEESTVVKIKVKKDCVNGGAIEFVTPPIKLGSENDYVYGGELADDIEDCKVEIARYMTESAPNPQKTLFDPVNDDSYDGIEDVEFIVEEEEEDEFEHADESEINFFEGED